MSYVSQVQAVAVVGAIVALVMIGFVVSLGSGQPKSSGQGRIWLCLGNLYRVAIQILAYLVGLLALQEIVGFPLDWLW
jgi:hypothetical protein